MNELSLALGYVVKGKCVTNLFPDLFNLRLLLRVPGNLLLACHTFKHFDSWSLGGIIMPQTLGWS